METQRSAKTNCTAGGRRFHQQTRDGAYSDGRFLPNAGM
jgi:hypothetical protein